jgi:hypothetical protein
VNIPAVSAAFTSKLSLSGGTLTGPLILQADPVTALGAATKQYVDAHGGGGGGGPRTTHVASSNFTIPTLTVDYLLNMDLTSGSLIAQLPDAVASNGYCADVKTTGINQQFGNDGINFSANDRHTFSRIVDTEK